MATEDSLERRAREAGNKNARGRRTTLDGGKNITYLVTGDSGIASKITESNLKELQLRRWLTAKAGR